ncbi:MAG: fibronectin type III domain-containing protein, partial [Patescibacteria group bacterium]|nr:fibronectin type III domain-containing protein [Patescibacteria group bacterium]
MKLQPRLLAVLFLLFAGISITYIVSQISGSAVPTAPTAATLAHVSGRSLSAAVEGAGSGLVGWWPFDDGAGSTAGDASGNGNTGTLVGSPTWTTGKIGGALQFNGTSQFVKVTENSGLPVYSTTSPYSVSLWFKVPDYADQGFYTEGGGNGNGTGRFVIEGFNQGAPYIYIWGPWTELGHSTTKISTSTWHHVVWTDNLGQTALYIDGVRDATNFNYTLAATSLAPCVYVGAEPFDSFCATGFNFSDGLIDDVRTYNRALSQSDVTALYNEGTASASSYTLMVTNSNSANGTVTSNPSGITCGSTCSMSVNSGTFVTLTATPATNYVTQWSGCTSVNANTCTVYVFGGNAAITATFALGPVFSNVSAGTVSQSGALIVWTTDQQSNSQVEYGLTNAYGSQTAISDTNPLVTSHSVQVTGLTANTVYHYRVDSTNAGGVTAKSADYTFTTSAPVNANGTVGPVISLSSNQSGDVTTYQPQGVLPYGTTQTTMQVSTDVSATCKWAQGGGSGLNVTGGGTPYDSMANTFQTTGGIIHQQPISGLSNGQIYHYFVRCKDNATNATNTADYVVAFSVAESADLIPSSRTVDWTPGVSVGVPGGIPHYPLSQPLNVVVNGTTIATIPVGKTIDVTQAPYNADPTDTVDATAAINQAIQDASPGDVVYMPAGKYLISGNGVGASGNGTKSYFV